MKEVEKSMPSHLGFSVPSHTTRIFRFVHAAGRFFSNTVYYQDKNSFYIHMDRYQKLTDAGYVGKSLGQGEIDHGDGGIFS